MSTAFEESPEFLLGDAAQKQWALLLAEAGNVVAPMYGAVDVSASTKAPVLFADRKQVRNGRLIAPDLFVCAPGKACWQDVKAKSVPGYLYRQRRWEHGVDFEVMREYELAQILSGFPVWLIVHEVQSPREGAEPPWPNGDWRDYERFLEPSGQWLGISLGNAFATGEARPSWPGGQSRPRERGKHGKGGWLWPRDAMLYLEPTDNGLIKRRPVREEVEQGRLW